ncbi:MAG: PEP/pyruvate-binding domain-containing protein [Bacteroidia bacterium]
MHFLEPQNIAQNQYKNIGGKAKNLHRLFELKLNVPDWIVIPTDALDNILKDIDLQDDAKVKSAIQAYHFPTSFIEEISTHFLNTKSKFAVRSSAADEDSADFSYAGQFESHLFVKPENLEEAIKKVWLSAYSERVKIYRAQQGLQSWPRMAVIIQEMIDADAAGVAFGIDPTSGDRKTKVISAVYGLGEGLVSGELNADIFKVKNENITSEIIEKTHAFVHDEAVGGLKKTDVPIQKQKLPALQNQSIFEIVHICETLQKEFGKPQDIEFAIAENKVYLLQSRPITNLHKIPDPEGEYIVWDNSNIIESYPGITSPLTFSFILKVYEAVYKQFSTMMGISKADIEENENVYANMLGLLNGRVYYNLKSWFKLLALLPGYSLNAEFMEKMMGVKERFVLEDLPVRTKFKERLRVANMAKIMMQNMRALPKEREKFVQEFNAVMEKFNKLDFDSCRADELLKLYLEFEQTLLKKWKAPLVNDFFTMIYFGTLQKLVVKYKIDDSGYLHNDLLCGAKDIISTEPAKRIVDITQSIFSDKHIWNFFQNNDAKTVWAALQNGELNAIKPKIEEYLSRFGDRSVGELKLETITFRQNPEAFIQFIKSSLAQKSQQQITRQNSDVDIRKTAEEKVAKALRFSPIKKQLFKHVLSRARTMVSSRENLRYERMRAFSVVRQIFLAMGKNFYSENIISKPGDIFYLAKEEIFSYIQGTSVNANLKYLIELRKAEFAAFEKMPTAERIPTRGIVYHGNNFNPQQKEALLNGDLKGIGCCPGIVKAKVRVLRKPDEIQSLDGDILVTSSTDPGWVILFPSASAILVERGSLLSHSAIVSREMGIPCIVGITGLLDRLKTGDEVEMDGSTGEIKIING